MKKNGKNGVEIARARAHGGPVLNAKGVKNTTVLRSLLSAMNDNDVEQIVRVYREAMYAEHRFWKDQGKDDDGRALGEWVFEPDHKTRVAAANMVAAYAEGLPVQRQLIATGKIEDFEQILGRVRGNQLVGRKIPELHATASSESESP